MRTQIRALATAMAIFTACSNLALASSDDLATPVRTSLASLNSWLGTGPNTTAWAKYLNLPGLEGELKKGPDADPAVISAVVKQLDSGAAGLELAPFRNLRTALVNWTDNLAVAKAPSLSEAAQAAESQFKPVPPEAVTSAKSALTTAIGKLDKFLSGANGKAWREYLRWDVLQTQLAAPTPDVEALTTVYKQFRADQVGLELPVFDNVATSLDNYITAVSAQRAEAQAQYATVIKELAEALKKYTEDHSEEASINVGARLNWLERMRQSGALVRAVRRQHSHPNLHVAASARLVTAGIEQPVDDTAPVRDFILGTSISGTGRTIGSVTGRLVPSEDNAMIELVLKGKATTRTVGYNGPATIYTNGDVQIAGSKRIILDATGFKSYKATGTADTKTKITGVDGSRIVQRVASKRISQQKGEAERIASDHAAVRVRGRVDAQADEQLGKPHADFVNKFRAPLVRRREFPELLHFRSTADLLTITGMKANAGQLGAPNDPPKIDGNYDLTARIHESLINNFAAALLAGVTIKEEDMQKSAVDLLGELPEKLKSEPDRDPWSITFANARPVSIKIADGGFQVTVRGQRYTSGERNFRAMNVVANYKVAIDGHGAKLTRQGDLVIVPPGFEEGKSRLSAQQITLRTLLEKRFGKLFEPEIKYEGLELPGNWAKAGRLDLKHLQAEAGWATMAWLESGEPVKEKAKKSADKVVLDKR